MKRSYIIVLGFLGLAFGCEDSLEFEVQDKLTLENYFLSETDAVASVNAVYDALGQVDEACVMLAEVTTRFPTSEASGEAQTARTDMGCS